MATAKKLLVSTSIPAGEPATPPVAPATVPAPIGEPTVGSTVPGLDDLLADLANLPVPSDRGTLATSAKAEKAQALWAALLAIMPATDPRRVLLATSSDNAAEIIGPFRVTVYAGSGKNGNGAFLRLAGNQRHLASKLLPLVAKLPSGGGAGGWPVTANRMVKADDGTVVWFRGISTPAGVLVAWNNCAALARSLNANLAKLA